MWLAGNAACSTNGQILVPLKSPAVYPSQDCKTRPYIRRSLRRQGLPKSGLQSNKEFMASLLDDNTFIGSVAFECGVGDVVLSRGALVTSLCLTAMESFSVL